MYSKRKEFTPQRGLLEKERTVSQKGSTLKEKNLLPKEFYSERKEFALKRRVYPKRNECATKFFWEVDSFSEGAWCAGLDHKVLGLNSARGCNYSTSLHRAFYYYPLQE